MNKITYLLGAGASFGQRASNGDIIGGVPVISEIGLATRQIINKIKDDISVEESSKTPVVEELKWLANICELYPTIDTYAKMVYITKRINDYIRLKKSLTVFFMLEQHYFYRDLRYDGFIASLIKEDGKFPPINILTWNYDIQFEKAYSDYLIGNKYINNAWNALNVMCKKAIEEKSKKGFLFAKLNGTALFYDDYDIIDISNNGYKGLNVIQAASSIISITNIQNILSYSWEDKQSLFVSNVIEKIKDTTSLIVIGYSFPYVNRDIDRRIINSMQNLNRIYIQDPCAEDIKENVQSVLAERVNKIGVFPKTNTRQFFIPNEL